MLEIQKFIIHVCLNVQKIILLINFKRTALLTITTFIRALTLPLKTGCVLPFFSTCLNVPVTDIGYEPADLTVHPPPQKNDRGWVHFFRIGV